MTVSSVLHFASKKAREISLKLASKTFSPGHTHLKILKYTFYVYGKQRAHPVPGLSHLSPDLERYNLGSLFHALR